MMEKFLSRSVFVVDEVLNGGARVSSIRPADSYEDCIDNSLFPDGKPIQGRAYTYSRLGNSSEIESISEMDGRNLNLEWGGVTYQIEFLNNFPEYSSRANQLRRYATRLTSLAVNEMERYAEADKLLDIESYERDKQEAIELLKRLESD